MTGPASGARRSLSRVLDDIAHQLESADSSDDRIRRVLALVRYVVPYDQCALLEMQTPYGSRIVVAPRAGPEEQAELTTTLEELCAELVSERADGHRARLRRVADAALAVPLIGCGEVFGVVFVGSRAGAYSERHLRTLAIVAGQLGAYLSMARVQGELQVRARELDEARRAALAASRAKDEYLAVVSHELKEPVASTLAWAHVLGAEGPNRDSARAAAAVERNARLLTKLIDDIQGMACVASAELRLDLRAVEPAHVLKAAIEEVRSPGEWRPARPEPTALLGEIASATKASPRGGPIAVRLDRADPSAAASPTPRVLDGLHVLLVDDDSDIRDAFQSVLEHNGATVTAVSSAAAALAALDRALPDVLLSDLGMPGESGYDLMRQVVARNVALPAAALTAYGRVADRERAIGAGFRMQLAKPIDATALVAAVADLAGRSPARRSSPVHDAGGL